MPKAKDDATKKSPRPKVDDEGDEEEARYVEEDEEAESEAQAQPKPKQQPKAKAKAKGANVVAKAKAKSKPQPKKARATKAELSQAVLSPVSKVPDTTSNMTTKTHTRQVHDCLSREGGCICR